MHKTIAALAAVLACCAQPAQTTTSEQDLNGAPSCTVPGAVPDDGLDDRPAIAAALASQGCALLERPGTYDLVVPSPRPAGFRDVLRLSGGMSIRGTGPATVLAFSGEVGASDIHGIEVEGDDNAIADLTLDTSGLVHPNEQTHVVQVLGPSLRGQISHVWFRHPGAPPNKSGDCVKVIGYDPTPTTPDKRVSLSIVGNIFGQCFRSGVAIHSGVTSLVVASNLFLGTGDQDVDMEGGGGIIESVSVTGNVFRRVNPATSVSLGAETTRRAVIAGNAISGGGGIGAYNVDDLVISGNALEVADTAISMVKISRSVSITGNTLTAIDPAATAPLIKASAHNTGNPGSIAITGNTLRSSTATGALASLISASDVLFSDNLATWTPPGAPPASTSALVIYGISRPIEAISVVGNVLRGPWTRAFLTTNSYEAQTGGGVRAVTFGGNVLRGPSIGMACQVVGPGPYVSYGNSGAPNSCAPATAGN